MNLPIAWIAEIVSYLNYASDSHVVLESLRPLKELQVVYEKWQKCTLFTEERSRNPDDADYIFKQFVNGVLHSVDGRAAHIYNFVDSLDGTRVICRVEKWYCNGILHNEYGPAHICRTIKPQSLHKYKLDIWYKNGLIHRDNGPAMILPDGTQKWYRNNLKHRDNDEPAIVEPDGTKWWYIDGKVHRDNGPAIIDEKNGHRLWCKNNMPHRDDDKPAYKKRNEFKMWYKCGVLDRRNGEPAVMFDDGTRVWYKAGRIYRAGNKPAIEHGNGSREYFYKKSGKFRRGSGDYDNAWFHDRKIETPKYF